MGVGAPRCVRVYCSRDVSPFPAGTLPPFPLRSEFGNGAECPAGYEVPACKIQMVSTYVLSAHVLAGFKMKHLCC